MKLNTFEGYVYEPIDLCACYEPMIEVPQELIDKWQIDYRAEPERVPTFYVIDEYGTLYFYHGNTRIKVSEHFNEKGKPIGTLIENVIRYSAAHRTEKTADD